MSIIAFKPPIVWAPLQERISRQASTHDTPAAQASDLLNLHEIVAKARQNLNQNDWDYIVGGAESETTLRRNRMALDSLAFRPRVLRDVSKVDCSVSNSAGSFGSPSCSRRSARWKAFMLSARRRWRAPSRSSAWRICSARFATPGSRSSPPPRRKRCGFTSSTYAAMRGGWTITSSVPSRHGYAALLPYGRHRALQPARARHRQELRHCRPAARAGPGIPGGARLDHGQAASSTVSTSRSRSRALRRRRTPGLRSIMGSIGSTSPITAAGSSITAAARWRCCRKWSMPLAGARRS